MSERQRCSLLFPTSQETWLADEVAGQATNELTVSVVETLVLPSF